MKELDIHKGLGLDSGRGILNAGEKEKSIEVIGEQATCSKPLDCELIASCLDGNREAWEALVDRYRRLVYSIPIKYGFSPEDSADIFQTVWLECFQRLGTLRNLEGLPSWLIRVAVRKCHRFYKIKRGRGEDCLPESDIGLPTGERSSEQLLVELDREETLRKAMSQLTPRCQKVIEHLFFQDPPLNYSQAAERLGLSDNSVGSARDRCLRCLQQILRELGFNYELPFA